MSTLANADRAARIAALADQCVMCGLCLPHCPTYRVQAVEGESPRGRVALARALAAGTLPAAPLLIAHLDQCLGCLACEAVCPSKVDYSGLMEQTRLLLRQRRPENVWLRRLRRVVEHPPWLGWAVGALRVGQRLGLWRWARRSRWLSGSAMARALAELPHLPAPLRLPARAPARGRVRGRVALFPGCVASICDRDTQLAAVRLLTHLGYEVHAPLDAACCGALAEHAGDKLTAQRLQDGVASRFRSLGIDTVIGSASGCHAALRSALAASGIAYADIGGFLSSDSQWSRLSFRPLAQTAGLHVPCTQASLVGDLAAYPKLLASIPDLRVLALPAQPGCCGAAGSYFLQHAKIADRLRHERLDQIDALRVNFLMTSNIGCRIFLGNGLAQRASDAVVRHPVAVLADQLLSDSNSDDRT